MRAGIVAGHDLVEWIDRPQVEVRLPAEIAPYLHHVTVDRLEGEFHSIEQRVDRLRIASEIRSDELFEGSGVAVFGPPEFGNLLQSACDPRTLSLSILRNQLRFEILSGEIHRQQHGSKSKHSAHILAESHLTIFFSFGVSASPSTDPRAMDVSGIALAAPFAPAGRCCPRSCADPG